MIPLGKVLRLATIAAVAMLAAACASAPSQARQSRTSNGLDLSGEWVLTTESQMGAQDALMTVRQTGSALTGTIQGRGGDVDYTGSVNGATVVFDFTLNVHGTDLKLDYSGTVEGDTIRGKTVFGQFGEGTFTAKRK